MSQRNGSVLTVLSLFAIAAVTLGPAPPSQPLPVLCILCGSLGTVDFVLNTLLFVPLGVGLRLRWNRGIVAVLIGATVTLVIETLQWRVIPGRDAALGDLVANTLGTIGGTWLAASARAWLTGSGPAALRRAWCAAVASGAILATTTMALAPVEPGIPLRVQWAPRRAGLDPFPGHQILSVQLNGSFLRPAEELPRYSLMNPDTRRTEIALVLVPPIRPSERRSIIARLAYAGYEGLVVSQEGDDILFRVHTVASRWKLRSLSARFDGALRSASGSTGALPVAIASTPGSMTVVSGSESAFVKTVERTPGIGWSLLLPWDLSTNAGLWYINVGWMAALFFPATLFAVQARTPMGRSAGRWWWPVIGLTTALLVFPLMTGIGQPLLSDWLGVAVGIGAAIGIAHVAVGARSSLAVDEPTGQV